MSIYGRCVSAFLLTGSGALWPTVARAAEDGNFFVWLGIPAVLAGAIATAISFVAPKIWETYNGALTARRKFIEGVTTDVVKLSGTHYWALANAAGTVGDLLHEHLRSMQAHLLLVYARPGRIGTEPAREMVETIDRVCKSTADRSFPSLVRLIVLFDRFQFAGSQTYLLPHHSAGIALRRLFNQFVAALPEDGFTADIRQGVERHLIKEVKPATVSPVPGIEGSFLEDDGRLKALGLEAARERYRRWLHDSPMNVSEAADALRAYAELFSHELAELNRVFFRDRGRGMSAGGFGGTQAVASSSWSGTVTDNSLLTLARAGVQSEFYRPLGGISALRSTTAAAAPIPPEDSESKARSTVQPPPTPTQGSDRPWAAGARSGLGSTSFPGTDPVLNP